MRPKTWYWDWGRVTLMIVQDGNDLGLGISFGLNHMAIDFLFWMFAVQIVDYDIPGDEDEDV